MIAAKRVSTFGRWGWLLGLATMLSSVGCAADDAFPAIDRERLLISLQRSACYGTCPDYVVTIDGAGNVVFVTRPWDTDEVSDVHRGFSNSDGVLWSGRHEDRIPLEEVDRLVEQFKQAGFFSLQNEYRAGVTDNPTYVLTIDTGHGRKQVVDYVGRRAGMPESVTNLERAVDGVAGTARWIDGASGLVALLERSGFDFASEEGAAMAVEGAMNDAADETLLAFIERGVPLTEDWSNEGGRQVLVGEALMDGAITRGRAALFVRLVELGWLDKLGLKTAERLFATSAGGCNPALAQAAIHAGLAIDAPGEDGETALAALVDSYKCQGEGQRVATARQLLDLGADPNRLDDDHETAIFGVENPELLDLLYARGADGTIKDSDGNSAVFSSWTDEIVLRHLEQGASPVGKYYDRRSLREQMRQRPMPKVARWLDERGL